jgi:hypothetical protein
MKRTKGPAAILVTGMRTKIPTGKNILAVNTTSHSKEPLYRQLSPFYVVQEVQQEPLALYGEYTSKTHENAWQYSKVYKRHVDPETGDPTPEYFVWAHQGWNNPKAIRYPMGKGARPEYSWWNGKKYGYVDARKLIYAPLYAQLVVQTDAYKQLEQHMNSGEYSEIWLRDFDGYQDTNLHRVMNNDKKKMGHAFVLAMLLTNKIEY